MISILFVDDEKSVLQGLKRTFRPLRDEWDMQFADSGQQALDMLSIQAFEVIVTDIQMPGINGLELLTEVKENYPQTIRIVLSAQMDEKMIMASTRLSHQFLHKPCDAEKLKYTIERTCRLQDLLDNTTLKQVVSKIDSLPSLPSLYAEIVEELESKDCTIQNVGKIISKDVGMTAKILHLVNSAFFGFPRHISCPAQAAGLLGLDTIKGLVLSVQIFSQFDGGKLPGKFLENIWTHSMTTGVLAKEISAAEHLDQVSRDHAFLAGLLHDAGKLVLSANFPDQYRQILGEVQKQKRSLQEGERGMFGTTHCEVGSYLMGLWGLPIPIIEAIAFHHDPRGYAGDGFVPLSAVHVANALDHARGALDEKQVPSHIDHDYLAGLNVIDRIPVWMERCRETLYSEEKNE